MRLTERLVAARLRDITEISINQYREKWRENANNRDRWKLITKVAVLRSDQ